MNMEYNKNISFKELKTAIKKSKNTSPGPDHIHYQLLKHLPESCLFILLNLLNRVWEGGEFPAPWTDATIIPIPKPGKDPKFPNNYRPIS
jgi:potassium voltage-gated channel Eag-related subfamily H protein 8